jgi:hypothetical protein
MRRRAEWSLVAVAVSAGVLAVAGCGSGAQTARGDGGHGDGEIDRPADSDGAADLDAPASQDAVTEAGADSSTGGTPASACRAAIEAQCRRQAACRNLDVPSCVATVVDRCPDYYFNSRSLRTVAEIESCLAAFAAMTCTDIAMALTPPCLRLGTGAGGSACLYNTECEFGCTDGLDRCATCNTATRAATGQPCDTTHFCASTDYCHTVTRTCASKASVVHAAEGQPCDFAAQPSVGCRGDLVCARTTTPGTAGICRPLPQLDQPCAMTGDPVATKDCGAGLSCNTQTMTCRPAPPASGGCGDAGACDDAAFCRGAFGPAATCVARALEGQACRLTDTSAGAELQCSLGVRCVPTPDAGFNGTCTAPRNVGDACDPTHPCGGSLCGAAGRCTPYAPAACQPGGADAGGN